MLRVVTMTFGGWVITGTHGDQTDRSPCSARRHRAPQWSTESRGLELEQELEQEQELEHEVPNSNQRHAG